MNGVRIVLILTIIGVVAGGALAGVFSLTDPMIQANRKAATEEAVKNVVPGAVDVKSETRGGQSVYKGLDKSGRLRGYAFTAEFSGFQGKIKVMVGMDTLFQEITGLDVLENVETPGLGNKISMESWRDGFKGLSGAEEIKLVKNQAADKDKNEVEAVTGATISSRSVVGGVNTKIKQVREAMGQ